MSSESVRESSSASLLLAFATVYLVWGSTYLAIKFAIETLPPFLMAGSRFLIAGGLMYLVLRRRERAAPTVAMWTSESATAALLLLGGNGLVTWSEQWIPSGIAALIVATIPLWMVLLEWIVWHGAAPGWQTAIGLVAGFAGVALLVDPNQNSAGPGHWPALVALLFAPLLWAIGSLRSRGRNGQSPLLASAMQMITGGVMMLLVGAVRSEWNDVAIEEISLRSLLSFVYLIFFGSILAFSAYTWLLRHASPSAVSTYAYVNPVVAVFLGWSLGDEPVHTSMLLGAALIVGSVALITLRKRRAPSRVATVGAPTAGSRS